ncbi:MAG: hypothetical protein JKY94_01060 [Rhodobacteraceae bacterium]|nr:hypothetical protein [Paracoccaceae bacterium]
MTEVEALIRDLKNIRDLASKTTGTATNKDVVCTMNKIVADMNAIIIGLQRNCPPSKQVVWDGHFCVGAVLVSGENHKTYWTLCGSLDVPPGCVSEGTIQDVVCADCLTKFERQKQ